MEDQVEHCECQALNNAQAACMMVALLSTTHPPKPGDDLSSFSQVPNLQLARCHHDTYGDTEKYSPTSTL